jgi:hypothetical protein
MSLTLIALWAAEESYYYLGHDQPAVPISVIFSQQSTYASTN